jgi:hypothetical protein
MEKKYIIGGLAIVGAIALFAYLKPKKKLNSDGFYGADGGKINTTRNKSVVSRGRCAWCKDSDGEMYHTGSNRLCNSGDRCTTQYSY